MSKLNLELVRDRSRSASWKFYNQDDPEDEMSLVKEISDWKAILSALEELEKGND